MGETLSILHRSRMHSIDFSALSLYSCRVQCYFLFLSFTLTTSALSLRKDPSVLCLIHTATPSHDTRAYTISETWARRCDDFLFFTNSPMREGIPHIYWPHLHSRDHSWEKIRRVFKYVSELPKKYDWYLRADDDAYVLVDNLRQFVRDYNSSVAHYFGYRWNFFVSHGYADGGAYVLSRKTVEEFARVMEDGEKCPDHHRAEEDQEIAKCLEAVGIYPGDSRDMFGSDRFHHFHPSEQLLMYKDNFARKFAYYTPLKGEDNFSPQMVSFHHISPYEMRVLDFLFYKLERHGKPKIPKDFS